MHKTVVLEATLNDVDALWRVEQHCFAPNRQSDPRAIRHGILSPNQHVFVRERIEIAGESTILGSATPFVYKHTLRIYSLAVLEAWRGQGLGESLIRHVSRLAANEGFSRITNWAANDAADASNYVGAVESVPNNRGPAHVLKTAVKAASLIGDGLYGVALKDVGGQAVVIEVNDNPNIDADLEDAILKEALYTRVMQTFMHRIEHERRAPTYTYSK